MVTQAAALVVAGLLGSCAAFGEARHADVPDRPPTFEEQFRAGELSLRGLSVVSADVAWASGTAGTVLRTIDGGATWERRTVAGAEDLDFRSIHAFGPDAALVLNAGAPARLYRTTDGGAHFELVQEWTAEGVFFDALRFADGARGAAFSDPVDGAFLVVVTEDGGATWRRLDPAALPVPLDGEAGFAASGTCLQLGADDRMWIGTGGGARARVLASTDGGVTWRAADTPLAAGSASRGVFSLAFGADQVGVAVGGDYREPDSVLATAAYSRDGGATWSAATVPPHGYRSAVAIVGDSGSPRMVCLTTGPNGTDWTRDGGVTWAPVTTQGFHALAFVPESLVGWAVGSEGRIVRVRF